MTQLGSLVVQSDVGGPFTVVSGGITVTSHTLSTSGLLASAARAVAQDYDSADQINNYCRGVLVIANFTALTATPAITPKLQIKDPTSSNYTTIWTGSVVTNVEIGTVPNQICWMFYPGAVDAAITMAAKVAFAIPQTWRWRMTHGDTDSATYSVSASYLL